MKLFMDIHVIQTVPPSCLNRDDTGSPKTALYGGARRARVSSQCWKREMRQMFKERFNESELAIRTLRLVEAIASKIPGTDSLETARNILTSVTYKKDGKDKPVFELKTEKGKKDELKALFFISKEQLQNIAGIPKTLSKKEISDTVKSYLKEDNGLEIALFGRMVATDPTLGCDASAQIAHAISTHRVENEYDYFTAVDDCSNEDHAGAAMIGTIEFNSATLYRYATVAVHELFGQLANDLVVLEKALAEFLRAFALSMPKGRQNPFAAHTLPYGVMVHLRTDRPLNLVDAFEKPIPIKPDEGFAIRSAEALKNHVDKVKKAGFCKKPFSAYIAGEFSEDLGEKLEMDSLIHQVAKDAVEKFTVTA